MALHFIGDMKIANLVFRDTRVAVLWFFVRVYVGYEWLLAGLDKVSNTAWVGSTAGSAVTGFLNKALEKTGGAHPDVSGWYAFFIENVALPNAFIWSHLVAYGEFFVGVGLIVGAFTGLAAFFGAFMNVNYMLAGSVSINVVLFILSIFLILAWRIAGYLGGDYFILKYFARLFNQEPRLPSKP